MSTFSALLDLKVALTIHSATVHPQCNLWQTEPDCWLPLPPVMLQQNIIWLQVAI